jgi:hypothetical protein
MSQHSGMDSIKIKGYLFTVINNYVIVLKKLTYNSKMLRLKNKIYVAVILINLL